MNYHKKGLRSLLDAILEGRVGRLVITHKDRLLRFGAELVFAICEAKKVEVVILNQGEDTTFEEDLANDVLENVIAQQLCHNGFALHYFSAPKYGEVDFVLQRGKTVIPMEVKSGKGFTFHRALDNILSVEEWKLPQAYVLCRGNLQVQDRITYLPWYMVMFLKQVQPPASLVHHVDLSTLPTL